MGSLGSLHRLNLDVGLYVRYKPMRAIGLTIVVYVCSLFAWAQGSSLYLRRLAPTIGQHTRGRTLVCVTRAWSMSHVRIMRVRVRERHTCARRGRLC